MPTTDRKPPRWARSVCEDELFVVTRDLARTLTEAPIPPGDRLATPTRPISAETYFRRLSQLVDRLTAGSHCGIVSHRDVTALSLHIRKYPGAYADLGAHASAAATIRWLHGLAAELQAARGPGEPFTQLERAAQLFATIADIIDASRRRRATRAGTG